MSVPCIGAVLCGVLLSTDVRDGLRLSQIPSPLNYVSTDDSGTGEVSDDRDEFSDAVKLAFPTIAHPGSGFTPQELEGFLKAPPGSVLSRSTH